MDRNVPPIGLAVSFNPLAELKAFFANLLNYLSEKIGIREHSKPAFYTTLLRPVSAPLSPSYFFIVIFPVAEKSPAVIM